MSKNLVFGTNAVREAIQDPSRIQKVLIEDGLKNPAALKLKDEVMRAGVSFSFVPPQKLFKHTKENHQGFVALLGSIQFSQLEDVIQENTQHLLCLLCQKQAQPKWLYACPVIVKRLGVATKSP